MFIDTRDFLIESNWLQCEDAFAAKVIETARDFGCLRAIDLFEGQVSDLVAYTVVLTLVNRGNYSSLFLSVPEPVPYHTWYETLAAASAWAEDGELQFSASCCGETFVTTDKDLWGRIAHGGYVYVCRKCNMEHY
jgi:hypothetical protein